MIRVEWRLDLTGSRDNKVFIISLWTLVVCICAELYQHDSWLSQCQWEPDKLHAVSYLKWASTTSRTWVLVLVLVALWTRNRDKLWFVGHRAGVVHRPQGSCGPQTTRQVWFMSYRAGVLHRPQGSCGSQTTRRVWFISYRAGVVHRPQGSCGP